MKKFSANYSTPDSCLYHTVIGSIMIVRILGIMFGIVACWGFVAALFSRRLDYGPGSRIQAFQTIMWFFLSIFCLQALHIIVEFIWLANIISTMRAVEGTRKYGQRV